MGCVVRGWRIVPNFWCSYNSTGKLSIQVLLEISSSCKPWRLYSSMPFSHYSRHLSIDSQGKADLPISLRKKDIETETKHIVEISSILNCSLQKAQMLCLKHDFLHEMSLDNLQERVQLILSYGIPYSVIYSHLRAVWYVSTETLAHRLELLRNYSLLDYKFTGFYLSCTKKELTRGLDQVSRNREALGECADQLEYVQHRLKINETEAKKLLSSTPFQRGYSPTRLKRQLDFFLNEARVSPEYLMKNYILLNYSVERLRDRLKFMKKTGITDPHLRRKVWRYTPKEFKQVFEEDAPETI